MTARCALLIPYFEAGERLIASLSSVDSLLSGDVDALVVDDGSRKIPAQAVLRATPFEGHVAVLELPSNQGVARALNAGLERLLSTYEFVARLDCGDRCVGNRLAAQMDFLDSHQDCAMVGTWTTFCSPSGKQLYTVRHPVEHGAIVRQMHVNCAFTHPTVMLRSRLIRSVGLYPVDREAAEDHAYFFTIASRFDTANIPEVHVLALIDPEGISTQRRRRQILSRLRILVEHFDYRPISVYGIVRAVAQVMTPRQSTVLVRRSVERIHVPRDASSRKPGDTSPSNRPAIGLTPAALPWSQQEAARGAMPTLR